MATWSPEHLLSPESIQVMGSKGPALRLWIKHLPDLLTTAQERWDLTLERPIFGGHTAGVFAVITPEGIRAVLKIVSERHFFEREQRSLVSFSAGGGPVPQLLDHDPEIFALLQERVLPGSPASPHLPGRVLAPLLASLHRCIPFPGIPTQGEVVAQRVAALKAIPNLSVEESNDIESASSPLLGATLGSALAHGDISPANILVSSSASSYCFIDAEAAVGDAEFDIAGWAIRSDPTSGVLRRAQDLCAAYGGDFNRVLVWLRFLALDEYLCHRQYGMIARSRAEADLFRELTELQGTTGR